MRSNIIVMYISFVWEVILLFEMIFVLLFHLSCVKFVLANPLSMACLEMECNCPFYFDPKCASNGITYPNGCYVNCYNRKQECEPKIYVVKEGRCSMFNIKWRPNVSTSSTTVTSTTKRRNLSYCDGSACNCRYGYNPVCGSDGVTYSNTCFIRCARKCNHDLVFVKCGLCGWTYPPHRRCLGTTVL